MMKTFSVKFASKPEAILELKNYLDIALKEINYSNTFFDNCLLILTEGVNNAIVHGNKSDENKFVSLSITTHEDELEFLISDEGEGFNIESIPDPTLPENLLKDNGRGIYLIKYFADKIEMKKNNKGSSLQITLKIK